MKILFLLISLALIQSCTVPPIKNEHKDFGRKQTKASSLWDSLSLEEKKIAFDYYSDGIFVLNIHDRTCKYLTSSMSYFKKHLKHQGFKFKSTLTVSKNTESPIEVIEVHYPKSATFFIFRKHADCLHTSQKAWDETVKHFETKRI